MEDEVHFTPEMVIAALAKERGIRREDLGVAPVVVVAWSVKVVRALAEATGADVVQEWMYRQRHPLYVGDVAGRRVSFAHLPVGAPGTIMMMEEMVAAGARTFWGFGTAGSLQESAPIGTCIIPTAAIAEEGTSAHYIEPGAELQPDPRLTGILDESCRQEGISPLDGTVWTTDAPYRETRTKIERYQRRGVLGVDMETSAMYAFGRVRGVSVCNLLVVSDELWRPWQFGGPALDEARERAAKVILRSVARSV